MSEPQRTPGRRNRPGGHKGMQIPTGSQPSGRHRLIGQPSRIGCLARVIASPFVAVARAFRSGTADYLAGAASIGFAIASFA